MYSGRQWTPDTCRHWQVCAGGGKEGEWMEQVSDGGREKEESGLGQVQQQQQGKRLPHLQWGSPNVVHMDLHHLYCWQMSE